MAHECPDCYLICYCGSDIDDLLLNDEDDIVSCKHCLGKEPPEDDWDDVYDDIPEGI